MERQLNNLKNTLNKSILKNIEVPISEKRRIMSVIGNTSPEKNKKRIPSYKYYLALSMAAVILIILIIPIFNQPDQSAINTLSGDIKEEFGHELYFPNFDKFPTTSVSIQYPPEGSKKDITFTYSKNKGELLEDFKSDSLKRNYEQSTNSKVLLGVYEGDVAFRITFSNFKSTFEGGEIKKINGINVKLDRTNKDFLFSSINTENGTYMMEFLFSKGFNEKNADEVLNTFTKNLK